MNSQPTPWSRLVKAARLVSAAPSRESAPAGFATRISALAMSVEREAPFSVVFARFSLRAVGVCSLVMLLVATLNISSVLNAFEGETVTLNDPVAEWFDAAS